MATKDTAKHPLQDTSEDDDKDMGDDHGPDAQAATVYGPAEVPMPTLTEEEYGDGVRVKCFIPGCNQDAKNCHCCLTHITKYHSEYADIPAIWKRTFFYKQANKERTAALNAWKKNPNPKKRAARRGDATASATPAVQSGSETTSSGSALINIGQVVGNAHAGALAIPAPQSGSETASSGSAFIGAGQSIEIPRPGMKASISSSMFVPRTTFETLIQIGLLYIDGQGKIFWNPDASVEGQKAALFEALPYDSIQRTYLGKQLPLIGKTEQAQPLVPLVQSANPSTILASPGGMDSGMQSLIVEMRNMTQLVAKLAEGPPTVALQEIKIKEDIYKIF